jgi:SPASM domain peptide maturase of grasp-with-spasm system
MKQLNSSHYFILYANCIPVKGATRSLICDLQLGRYFYVPNSLLEILKSTKEIRLLEILNSYEDNDRVIVESYFDFLVDNNLGFLDTDPKSFPDLSLEWDFPSEITNSIVDIEPAKINTIDYKKIFKELDDLNCICMQIRFFGVVDILSLDNILSNTLDSRIKEIRILSEFSVSIESEIRKVTLFKHKRISQIIFYNCSESRIDNELGVPIIYVSTPYLDSNHCGQVCRSLFSINVPQFTEAQNFNSCLNRKISIDSNGRIKNCPSQNYDFGNANQVTLKEVLLNEHFRSLWKVKKDDITICKDCEYRYICTDCRVFIKESNNLLSKPSKCTYDPYTASWN